MLAGSEPVSAQFFNVLPLTVSSNSAQNHITGAGSKKRFVIRECLHRRDEIALGIALHDESARPGLDNFPNQAIGVIEGYDQHFRAREFLADSFCGFYAVQLRHVDIQDDNVRLELLCLRNRLPAVTSLRANFPAFARAEQLSNSEPHQVVIVRYQNPKGHLKILPTEI